MSTARATSGCGYDCAPGAVRREQIQRQVKEKEDAKLIAGKGVSGRSGSPKVKDEKEGARRVGRVGQSRGSGGCSGRVGQRVGVRVCSLLKLKA
jgi:hypothetical protein